MPTSVADDQRQLIKYLRDHRAGSAAGISVVRHCGRANEGTELGRAMLGLADEFEHEIRALEAIIRRLGGRPSRLKILMGALSAQIGRLKVNDQLVRYSALSRLVELEGLAAGIRTKMNLWRALSAVAERYAALDPAELDRLDRQAATQLELVLVHHRQAAGAAL